MRKIGTIILLTLCIGNVKAQLTRQDSVSRLSDLYLFKVKSLMNTNGDSARYYTDLLLDLARTSGDKRLEALSFRSYGNYYWYRSEYDQALQYYNQALSLFESIGDLLQLGSTQYNIGLVYGSVGNRKKALSYYFESLTNVGNQDKQMRAMVLNSIGILYRESNDLDSAMLIHNKAMILFEEADDMVGVAGTLVNMGNILWRKKDIKEALKYQWRAHHLFDSLGNKRGKINALNNLGEIHTYRGDYASARKFRFSALKESRQIGMVRTEVSALLGLGEIELKQGNLTAAERDFREADSLAKTHALLESEIDILHSLGQCLEQQHKFREASGVWQQVLVLNDSLLNKEKIRQIENLKFDYALRNKEAEITLLKKDNEIKELYRNVAFLSLGAVLLIALGIVLRIRLNQQRNLKRILEQEVSQRTYELTALNKQKDLLFSIIGHDLRSPINSLRGILDLLAKKFISSEEFISCSRNIQHQVKETSFLLENLLSWSKGQLDKTPAKSEQVLVEKIVMRTAELFRLEAENKSIKIVIQAQPNIRAIVQESELDIIVRNLVFNAIKFSNVNGEVLVKTEISFDEVKIVVRDFGLGMSEDQQQKLFTLGIRSTRGTQNEKGSGLGLLLCKELVTKNNGTITVWSEPGKGTSISVFFQRATDLIPEPEVHLHLTESR